MAIEDYICSLLLSRCGHALLATGNGPMSDGRVLILFSHSEEDSKPSTQEVGADYSDQLPAPARISTNNYSSWSSSLQVSWKGIKVG